MSQQIVWRAVTLDCLGPRRVVAFWAALLGSPVIEPGEDRPGWFRLQPRGHDGPFMNFQPVEEPKVGNVRFNPVRKEQMAGGMASRQAT